MRLVRLAIIALLIIAWTALGAFIGWAMDHSMLPPEGGGWRCYVSCIAILWAIPAAAAGIASLPSICRWVTRTLSA